MASIRRRGDKWQTQVRRKGQQPLSRSFHIRKDAELWARQMEVSADRGDLLHDPKVLARLTLGELVQRYRETVTGRKKGHEVEAIAHAITSDLGRATNFDMFSSGDRKA